MIKFDNGIEYTFEKFNKFCGSAGIEHQLIAPYTPKQNGVVEKKIENSKLRLQTQQFFY